MKRRFLVAAPLLAGVCAVIYFVASVVLYQQLTVVAPHCGDEFMDNTPAHFSAEPFNPDLDTSPYLMPEYQTVSIPSRDAGITLSGWYVPASEANAPAVLVIHGLGASGAADCRRQPRALLLAGMLHRAGYSVLLIDLRDHGDSTIEDGLWAANTEEYRDVLGAWDWLVNVQQISPEHIGLFGYSGGTGGVMIAMGEEPRIAAVWLDSPYADITTSIEDRLVKMGYPKFLAPGGMLIARLHGDNLTAYSPLSAASKVDGRPVFITHSDTDPTLPVSYGMTLADALRSAGGSVELWIVHGSGHVTAMFDHPAEYEQKLVDYFNAYIVG